MNTRKQLCAEVKVSVGHGRFVKLRERFDILEMKKKSGVSDEDIVQYILWHLDQSDVAVVAHFDHQLDIRQCARCRLAAVARIEPKHICQYLQTEIGIRTRQSEAELLLPVSTKTYDLCLCMWRRLCAAKPGKLTACAEKYTRANPFLATREHVLDRLGIKVEVYQSADSDEGETLSEAAERSRDLECLSDVNR